MPKDKEYAMKVLLALFSALHSLWRRYADAITKSAIDAEYSARREGRFP